MAAPRSTSISVTGNREKGNDMPRLKDAEVLDVDELEEAEYEEGDFQKYTGEIPATGTMLVFRVTKMWWTYSSNDDPMLKMLCVAEDNPGSLEEYDGLTAWENMVLTASAKFKWAPFLEHFDLTIRDVRNKLIVADEDDTQGAPITKIARLIVGSDDFLFVGVVSKERYQGKCQAHISEWLDADTELDEPEEEPEEKPARRRASNGGRTAKRPAAATKRGRSRRDEPEDEEVEDEEPEDEEQPPARSRRKAPARSAAKKPVTRGTSRRRASSKDDEDEPPF